MLKNGPWPQLLEKHIKFANGCFEEKLEPNGQSTVRLALILAQNNKSLFHLLRLMRMINTYQIVKRHFAQLCLEEKLEPNGQWDFSLPVWL